MAENRIWKRRTGHLRAKQYEQQAQGRESARATSWPAPVALLKQVWPEAQERPLPQSMPAGAIVGRAEAPHRMASTHTKVTADFIENRDAKVCGLILKLVESQSIVLFLVIASSQPPEPE